MMDLTSGFCEEERTIKGKLPFSSSCSSSSASSCQYKGVVPLTNGRWQQRGWVGCYEGAPCVKLEMPGNEDDMNDGREAEGIEEREHMFDKVVTPSDVGKLNRLVIPKQHAEKYFPLDSSSNEKGLLLNFEDRSGKPWRFRYSYWNSSQSYVMTKGWSRFVKEKKLDAGDIVSFQRGVGELGKDRLYIDWRRRPDAPDTAAAATTTTASMLPNFSLPHHFPFHTTSIPWNPLFMRPPAPLNFHPHSHITHGGGSHRHHHHHHSSAGSVFYNMRSAAAAPQEVGIGMVQVQQQAGVEASQLVFESVPVVHGKAAAKRLRLFGVNMDCPISESDDCQILSSTTIPHAPMAPSHSSYLSPTSSSPSLPPLQLRLYNANPLPTKSNPSTSLDLDI